MAAWECQSIRSVPTSAPRNGGLARALFRVSVDQIGADVGAAAKVVAAWPKVLCQSIRSVPTSAPGVGSAEGGREIVSVDQIGADVGAAHRATAFPRCRSVSRSDRCRRRRAHRLTGVGTLICVSRSDRCRRRRLG